MNYVEVLVADVAFHKNEALTYSTMLDLEAGRVVVVPLRNKPVPAVVVRSVTKPAFVAKEIISAPDLPPLPTTHLHLIDWIREYYPAPLGTIVQLFLPSSFAPPRIRDESSASNTPKTKLPPLTTDQKDALDQISTSGLHILHGETGSGKTRVYVELTQRQLDLGKSSIILTPEIGLTSQLADTFKKNFGGRVVLMHSGLTDSARRAAWLRVLHGNEPLVIVGARSAIFAPLKNLGLVVIDESHETAYKQDQSPYYQTSAVAAKLAELFSATLVLGSATPLVRDYYVAKAKERPIIRITQVAAGRLDSESMAEVIDLKDRTLFQKSAYLSTKLLKAIQQRLNNHEQTLLFLNRRGTARIIFCNNCGWQALCPHCDLPLVYHGDEHAMRCHSCNYKAPTPTSCPSCQNPEVIFRSIGTKAIADEVKSLFPAARIMRFDTDNKKSERLETHYDAIRAGDVDIIVGTQTLAKGLDLPKLGLVGVVIADTSLYFPDFSAQERTYQLLSQVLGRVGRGHRASSAIIQTYSPDSPLIQSVMNKDWNAFYNRELEERRLFTFPPYCYLLKLSCKRASDASAQKAATHLANEIRSKNNSIVVDGPVPSFHGKVQNKFVWQLIVKAKRREQLTNIIHNLPSGWSYDIDPLNLL